MQPQQQQVFNCSFENQKKPKNDTIEPYSTSPFEEWHPFIEMYEDRGICLKPISPFYDYNKIDFKIEDSCHRRKSRSVDVPACAILNSATITMTEPKDEREDSDEESKHGKNFHSSSIGNSFHSKTRWNFEQDLLLGKVLKQLLPLTNVTYEELRKGKGRMRPEFKKLMIE